MLTIEQKSNRQIKIGGVLSYVSLAVNILSGLLYTPWMIQCIGQSDYGLYTLAGSLISMFMVDFGISSAISRFLSKYLVEGQQDKVNNILGIVYKLYLIVAVVILLVLVGIFIFLESIYVNLAPEELQKFKVIFVIVSAYSIFSFVFMPLNGILTSYEKFIALKLCTIISKITLIVTMIVALLMGLGVFALVLVNALCGCLTIAAKLWIVKCSTPVKVNIRYRDEKMLRQIFGFSTWATVISLTQRLIFVIMPSILAALSGAVSVAIFGVASAIEGYIFSFSDALNGMFLPKTSRIIANEEDQNGQLLQLMTKVGRINLIIVALVEVGFICAGREFVQLWVGKEYMSAYYAVVLIILPDLVYAPQQIARTALIAKNKIKYQALVYTIIGITNVVIACILCPRYGIIGAGISIGVTYVLRLILMSLTYWKILKINLPAFFKECHMRMGIPILVSFAIGMLVFLFAPSSGWLLFSVKCLFTIAEYSVIMWLFAFNSYEKGLAKSFIRRFTGKHRNIR